jgi:hypothetical protein
VAHPYTPGPSALCAVCALPQESTEEDLNVLNFERFKWGGVRRDDIPYAAFDLEQFQRAPREPADESSITAGREMLTALRELPAEASATIAARRLRTVKGNVAEREVLLDILGVAGILAPSEHPGYLHRFIPFVDRDLPAWHYVERSYPVCWWRGSDGVDQEAVSVFLPLLQ